MENVSRRNENIENMDSSDKKNRTWIKKIIKK